MFLHTPTATVVTFGRDLDDPGFRVAFVDAVTLNVVGSVPVGTWSTVSPVGDPFVISGDSATDDGVRLRIGRVAERAVECEVELTVVGVRRRGTSRCVSAQV